MASGIRTSIKVEGLNELRIALQELPIKAQERVLPGAVAKGAVVIRNLARKYAPTLKIPTPRRIAGLLRRMIRSTRGVRRATEATAFVSVRRLSAKAITKFKRMTGKGSSENQNDPFYWRFQEFGTAKMAAKPFLRPAFDQGKEQAVQVIKDELSAGIEREITKLRKFKA